MSKKQKRSKRLGGIPGKASAPTPISLAALFAAPPQIPAQPREERKASPSERPSRRPRTWLSRIPGEKHVFKEMSEAQHSLAPKLGYREPPRLGPDQQAAPPSAPPTTPSLFGQSERAPLSAQVSAALIIRQRYSLSALSSARYHKEHFLNISPARISL